MGQSKSIIEYTYDQTDKLIQISDEFTAQHWNSERNDGVTNYWIGKNKLIRAQIAADKWPANNPNSGLKLGSHYYSIINKNKQYDYNVDEEEWVNKIAPPEGLSYFIKSWENLIKSAENASSKLDQNGEASNNNSGILGLFSSEQPHQIAELQLPENERISFSDLSQHIKGLREGQMVIIESNYSNDDSTHEVESEMTITSDLEQVKNQIKEYWQKGIEMLPEGQFPIVEQVGSDQLLMGVKAPEGGFSLTISNISDSNWRELTDFMDEEKIIDIDEDEKDEDIMDITDNADEE